MQKYQIWRCRDKWAVFHRNTMKAVFFGTFKECCKVMDEYNSPQIDYCI